MKYSFGISDFLEEIPSLSQSVVFFYFFALSRVQLFVTPWTIQIAVKRREAKTKGEKERYKHLNEEFQKISRRD